MDGATSAGFSLIEMLVAVAVSLAVTAGALTLALSSRRLYEADQARTRLNQNLRASKDFLATDIRQLGERLNGDFPALQIVAGASGAPDELVVRRNLLDTVVNVCFAITLPTQNWIIIGFASTWSPPPQPGCFTLPGAENLMAWRDYRLASGGTVVAYIYDPITGDGEFFDYVGEQQFPNFYLIRAESTNSWEHTYPLGSRVYILEERRYRMNGDVLQLVVNDDDTQPVNLVDTLEDFQIRALYKPDPPDPTPPPAESFGFGDAWTDLRAVEVTVEGRVPVKDRFIERAWTAEIMPRNVLSQ
jgi:type IV pilus assembly protein PilW